MRPSVFPLLHPSPRNTHWLMRHLWFERELLPVLRETTGRVLDAAIRRGVSADPLVTSGT